jgi:hypothetical protein
MLAYTKENFGNRFTVNESEKSELKYLREELPKLRLEMSNMNGSVGGERDSTASDGHRDDSDDDSSDES